MTDERNDPEIVEALFRLASSIEVPPVDAAREQALLSAFDSHFASPRPKTGRLVWTVAAAVLIAMTATINWVVVKERPQQIAQPAVASDDLADFVPLPGADAWPPFESGAVIRVDLPLSALLDLGLAPPASALGVVQADIVVAQDGFARAVRLVQQ